MQTVGKMRTLATLRPADSQSNNNENVSLNYNVKEQQQSMVYLLDQFPQFDESSREITVTDHQTVAGIRDVSVAN